MSDAYVIEVHGKTVGLIIREPHEGETYRFLASLYAVIELEGQSFPGPYEAEQAARRLLSKSKRPRAQSQNSLLANAA